MVDTTQQKNDPLKSLYDAVSQDLDIGTFEDFSPRMDTKEKRKKFYDAISQDLDIGDYNTFEDRMGKSLEVPTSSSAVTSKTSAEQSQPSTEQSFTEPAFIGSGVGADISVGVANITNGTQREFEIAPNLTGLENVSGYSVEVGEPSENVNSFLKDIDASAKNFVTQMQGFDDRLVLFSTTASKAVLGETLARKFYGLTGRDLAGEELYAYEQLQDLSMQQMQASNFTDSKSLSDFASATVDASFSMIGTVLTSTATLGAGLVTEMVGGSIYDFNNAKAQHLGISVEDLYKSGKEEILLPSVLGGIALSLEKYGMKGVSKAFTEKLTGSAYKKIGTIAIDMNREGMTEWVQTGVGAVNEFVARGGKIEDSVGVFKDALLSKNGLEAYLKGAAGSASIGVVGYITNGIVGADNRKKSDSLVEARSALIKDLSATNDPVIKDAILSRVENISEEIQTLVDSDTADNKIKLSEEDVATVSDAALFISEVDARIKEITENPKENGELSEETIKSLNDQKEATQLSIDTIINSYDKENQTGIQSNERIGQESIQTESDQGTSGEASESRGVFQAPSEEIGEITAEYIPTETVSEVQSDPTFWEDVSTAENRTARLNTLEERIRGYKDRGIGIANDPKEEARYWRDITEYAVIKLIDGSLKTAKQLADVLNLSNDDAQKLLNDAKQLVSVTKPTNTGKQPSVKSTIIASTKRGITGSVTISEKAALRDTIKTLNRGARDMATNVKELSGTIEGYLAANKGRLKGAKIPTSIVSKVARAASGVVSEKQLERSLDVLEKVIGDAEFRGKLAKIDTYQGAVKRAVKTKDVPSDLRSIATQFANINTNDLDVDQLDRYLTDLDTLSRVGFVRNETVTAESMRATVELSNENAAVRKSEKAMNAATMEATAIREERTVKNLEKGLLEKGLSEDDIKQLSNSDLSMTERLDNLNNAKEELTVTKEQQLRESAKSGFNEVIDNLSTVSSGMTGVQKDILNDFVNNLNINILPSRYLKSLNFVLDNLLNNGSTVGIGLFTNIGEFQTKLNNEQLFRGVVDSLTVPSGIERWLISKGATSGSQQLTSIVDNVRGSIGKVTEFLGFTTFETNSLKASERYKNEVLAPEREVFKKYKKDLGKSADWMKADLFAISRQVGLEDAVMRTIRGYENMKEFFRVNAIAANQQGSYEAKLKNLIDEVADYTIDANGDITINNLKKTEEDLFNETPKGIQEWYNFARTWSAANEADFFAVIEAYENKTNEVVPNYIPISYFDYTSTEIQKARQSGSGLGTSLRAPTSTAAKDRTINKSGVPEGRALHLGGMLINFSEHAGELLNDIHTLKNRKYTTIALDYKRNGMMEKAYEGADYSSLDIAALSFESKAQGDILQYRSGITNEFNPLGSLARTLSNFGAMKALSSVTQPLKQTIPPLINTMFYLKNPASLGKAFMLVNSADPTTVDFVNTFANVTKRDTAKTYGNFTKSSVLDSEVDNLSDKLLNDITKKVELYVGETGLFKRVFNQVMLKPDLWASKVTWMSLYTDKASENGGVVNFSNPNTDAIAYANRVSSNISNESDSAMASKLTQNLFVKLLFPFMSFAFNSRTDMLMNLGKLTKGSTSASGRIEATRAVAGNLGNIVMFHLITETITRSTLNGASYIASNLVEALSGENDDEEESDKALKKLLENLAAQTEQLSNRAFLNRITYFTTDILFGGVFQEQLQPIVGTALNEFAYKPVMGEQYVKDSGYSPIPYKPNLAKGTAFESTVAALGQFGGTIGVGVEQLISTGVKISDAVGVVDGDGNYNKALRGFAGADGSIKVEQMYTDPENAQVYGTPDWYEGAVMLDAFVSSVGTLLVSEQVIRSVSNRTVSLLKKLHKEEIGVIKTEKQLKNLVESRKNFDSIEIGGKKVDLSPEAASDLYELFLDELSQQYDKKAYEKVRAKMTLEEYEDATYKIARLKAEREYLRDKKGFVKESREKEKESKKETEALRKKIVGYSRSSQN